MKITTKKFVLQQLLDKAQNVIPSKDVVPVLKNFRVEATEPGLVQITATDLKLTIVASTEMVEVIEPGIVVLPARQFLRMVHEADNDDLTLSVLDGQTAYIYVGRAEWKLKLMDGEDYPNLPDLSRVDFTKVDRSVLLRAIKSVRYAAATETVRPSLMLIDVHGGKARASDGVRFQQVDVGPDIPDLQIPILAVDDLVKILHSSESDIVEIGEDTNSLIFRIGRDVFIAQKLNANFPDVDAMLLTPAMLNDQVLIANRHDLMAAIKRVRITADPDTSAIILHLDNGTMLVTSKDKYNSSASEELDVEWTGNKRRVAFNHVHLMQMLSMSESETAHFKLGKDTRTRPSPILLEDGDMVGVLNQVRTDWLS